MDAINSAPSAAPTPDAGLPAGFGARGANDNSLTCEQVLASLASEVSFPRPRERRTERRLPYPHLIHLTPVTDGGEPLVHETQTVVGKNLSQVGIGFYHQQQLPYRRAIASLQLPDGAWVAFVTDLGWKRFVGHGWYESGGRFVRPVKSPLARGPQPKSPPRS